MADAPWKVAVLLEVVLLVAPLRHDSQRVLEKGDDDEEASEGRQVRLDGLRVLVDEVFYLGRVGAHLV